jgi:hypothetical protein
MKLNELYITAYARFNARRIPKSDVVSHFLTTKRKAGYLTSVCSQLRP